MFSNATSWIPLCLYVRVNFFRSFSCPGMLLCWSDRMGRIPQYCNLPGCSFEAGRAAYFPSHLSFFFHIPTIIILFSYLCFLNCFRSTVHKNIPLQRTRASVVHTSNCIQHWHRFTLCEFLSLDCFATVSKIHIFYVICRNIHTFLCL